MIGLAPTSALDLARDDPQRSFVPCYIEPLHFAAWHRARPANPYGVRLAPPYRVTRLCARSSLDGVGTKETSDKIDQPAARRTKERRRSVVSQFEICRS